MVTQSVRREVRLNACEMLKDGIGNALKRAGFDMSKRIHQSTGLFGGVTLFWQDVEIVRNITEYESACEQMLSNKVKS
jgi:hypothetical protein